MVCAGCSTQSWQTFYGERGRFETNYLTFEHSFTDAGAADARKRAQTQCAYRKQAAVRTSGTCSLTRCTTNFQCMDAADAAKYQTGDDRK